jgi:hypothetical protein
MAEKIEPPDESVPQPGTFADTDTEIGTRDAAAPAAPSPFLAGCLSAVVTSGVAVLSLQSDLSSFVALVFLLGALLVSLPLLSVVLLLTGKRGGAKAIIGVWLGLLIPALFVWWAVGLFSQIM